MRERPLLLLLVAVQFVPMVDGVLLMPLGQVLMHDLKIGTGPYGALLGASALAAAIAGLIGVAVLDRLPRRPAMVAVLAAFAVAEAICATASSYEQLLVGRFLAGGTAGLIGALIFSIVGDAVPPERRGAATGTVMSAFAIASILGVPIGAFAGIHGHWQWPFACLGILAVAAILIVSAMLPRFDGHLGRSSGSPWTVLRDGRMLRCYGLSAGAAMAGFLVIPLISPYLVGNAGLPIDMIPAIYFVGGLCSVVSTPFIGRLADRLGALRVFVIVSLIATIPLLVITHLPPAPVWVILLTTTVFIIFSGGRFTAHAALLGVLADPAHRAAAFAFNSAMISVCMGASAIVGGHLAVKQADDSIAGYGLLGIIAAAITVLSLLLAVGIRRRPV